jgi:hypothetical protein
MAAPPGARRRVRQLAADREPARRCGAHPATRAPGGEPDDPACVAQAARTG